MPADGSVRAVIGTNILRRFDLIGRTYEEVIRNPIGTDVGISLQILNNRDYCFILRRNLARTAARCKTAARPRVENNIVLLDESTERRKSVQQVAAKPLVRGGKARP